MSNESRRIMSAETRHADLIAFSKQPAMSCSLEGPRRPQYRRMHEASGEPRLASQRRYLFPAPSAAQGELLEAFMRRQGVCLQALPVDDEETLTLGRRYTNRGQCAPVVYTTGSLVKFLLGLRRQGLSDEQIEREYGFITIQPITCICRRGAFEEEYRKALHAIGLRNFVFEFIDIGLPRPSVSGLKFDISFYRRVFLAVMIGDILNDIQRRIRPYETKSGETDRVMAHVRAMIGDSYQDNSDRRLSATLKQARKLIEQIPVDLAQLKPKVRIVGEYQVASTEGHCTGDMFRWLESQGAEVALWQVTIFMLHKIWYRIWRTDRTFWARKRHSYSEWKSYLRKAVLARLTYRTLTGTHRKYARLLGGYAYPLPNMRKMMLRTDDLYHRAFLCDAGFTEIAQHIAAFRDNEADMVLSLKAFTCLPSGCSDAVQSKVERQEPDSVFLALEMSGDAIANCRSRVQMKLTEARRNLELKLAELSERRGMDPRELVEQLRSSHPTVEALRIRKKIPGCTLLALAQERS